MPDFRLPGLTQRIAVIGRTGSGKTQLAFWMLSKAPFHKQPYVIIDYKGEDLFAATDRIREIGLNELPKQPGLYRVSPRPNIDDDAVDSFLWNVWQRENTGLVVDEGYRLPPKGNAFEAILTQGRSKHLPVICCTQRPSWISRFVFSEADYYSVFHLNEKNDKKRVQEFIPPESLLIDERLPDYHSYWYDVGKNAAFMLKPVPNAETLVQEVHDRLKPQRRII